MPNCPHCGVEAAEGRRFCTSCGKLLPQEPPITDRPFVPPSPPTAPTAYTSAPSPAANSGSESNPPARDLSWTPPAIQETAISRFPPPPAPPRPNRSWLAVVAAVVVLGAAAAASLLFVNKSPKRLFLEAQASLAGGLIGDLQAAMGPSWELQERMQKEPYQSTVKVTADFDVAVQDPSAQMVKDLLQRSSLVMGARHDPTVQRQLIDFTLNVKGTDLVAGEFYQSPDELALKVPVLHSKYLQLENKDLRKTFADKGIPYTGPDRIVTASDYQRFLKVDEAKWEPLLKEYARYVHDFIQDDEIALERSYPYQSPDGEVTMKRITLTLSEQRVKDLFVGLGRKFRDDEDALDLVATNVSGWASLMVESASLEGSEAADLNKLKDKESVKQQIRDGVLDWEESWSEVELPNGLQITTVLDSKNNPVEQEITLTVVGNGGPVDLKFTVTRWNGSNGTQDRNFVFMAEKESKRGGFEWKSHTVPVSKAETKTTSTFLFHDNASMDPPLKGQVIATVVKGAQEGKDQRTYDFSLDMGQNEPDLTGQVSILHTSQATGKRFEASTTATLDLPADSPVTQVKLTFDSATDLGGKGEFPTFSDANAVNINKLSRSEWDQLVAELSSATERFLMRNMTLFMN